MIPCWVEVSCSGGDIHQHLVHVNFHPCEHRRHLLCPSLALGK
jgi:hypothetical protein